MSHTVVESNWSAHLWGMLRKLHPRAAAKNPVMFMVFLGAVVTSAITLRQAIQGEAETAFSGQIALWLWLTVLFANLAESVAEGRGRAQAETLKKFKVATSARRLSQPSRTATSQNVSSSELRKGDFILVEAGEQIPADGEVVEGVASVDESAITGESAPVVRESGGDRSAVTGGTRVLSDWLIIRIEHDPGQGFLDRMISMVEGAARQKTPNELALNILLSSFSLVFLMVCASLLPFSIFSVNQAVSGQPISISTLMALLVCLIPTTIGGLLSAIGIAGMDRLIRRNIIALSGRAVEAAGDVDILLLDKTGTITHGNRRATQLYPFGVSLDELARVCYLTSMADDTPEGKSLLVLSQSLNKKLADLSTNDLKTVPFTAQTRMSGANDNGQELRKGAPDTMQAYCQDQGHAFPDQLTQKVNTVARAGGTPLVVAANGIPIGAIELKDIVKDGIKTRFEQLRQMGIKTVMITGDNPLTAAAIAAEAGVDDFMAQATPEAKLAKIREFQQGGRLVAMTGDGTNDAPALAQADVAVAMNSGTQAAREAANMVDLDSDPTKLIDIVQIGKQLLITRGALTTFSLANDVAKYFAIIPAAFASTYPILKNLNVMQLATPHSAILSAVIFNALVIVALIPLALRGVAYRPVSAGQLLRDHLLIYGLGGVITPFIGIKLVDILIFNLGLA